MKHHSSRVPRKNYRDFAGSPLYERILDTLNDCSTVDHVAVNTDSDVIWDGISDSHPDVELIRRPKELRGDEVPMNDILLHDVDVVDADLYLQTHSTNPLLRAETIDDAVESLLGSQSNDSLFSVTAQQVRFWTVDGEPINHDPQELLPTQELTPLYEENSCIYLFEAETLKARENRIGYDPLLFEIEQDEAWDIDEPSDFRIAELLYEAR